jgi:hypothetical protein
MCFTLFRKKYYYNKIMHYDDIITHYIYCKSCYKSTPDNITNINCKECKLINDTCFYDTIEYAAKHKTV